MAELVIIADLPVGSANDIDTTELALLLRDVKAANIIDYANSSDVTVTPNTQPDYGSEYYPDSDRYYEG